MDLKELISYYNITSIYHFTDKSNLPSIEKYGIQSLKNIKRKNIKVSCYGADELSHKLDMQKGLDNFVHLALIQEHPMQYIKTKNGDIPNPVWIEIDISAIFENKTIFSDQVANKNGAKLYNIENLGNIIDLEVLWGYTNWSDPEIIQRRVKAKKAEIMVFDEIPTSKIKRIVYGN